MHRVTVAVSLMLQERNRKLMYSTTWISRSKRNGRKRSSATCPGSQQRGAVTLIQTSSCCLIRLMMKALIDRATALWVVFWGFLLGAFFLLPLSYSFPKINETVILLGSIIFFFFFPLHLHQPVLINKFKTGCYCNTIDYFVFSQCSLCWECLFVSIV